MKRESASVLHPAYVGLRLLVVTVCLGVVAGLTAPTAHAQTKYAVALNTSSLAGTPGLLAFDLIGGDAAIANNTASITGLATDGTLSSFAPLSLTDTAFFNEELRAITFGTFARFNVALTENVAAPGVDQFSFFLLDPITMLPLFSTTDSLGVDALFAIDVTGAPGGDPMMFASVNGAASWAVAPAPVPEGGATAGFLALGALALIGLGGIGRARVFGERFA